MALGGGVRYSLCTNVSAEWTHLGRGERVMYYIMGLSVLVSASVAIFVLKRVWGS
jgi:hypothetical protein